MVENKFLYNSITSTNLQIPMDHLLNGFWDTLPAVKNYEAMTKLIIAASKPRHEGGRNRAPGAIGSAVAVTHPADEDRQLMLLHLLNSCSRRVHGVMMMDSVPNINRLGGSHADRALKEKLIAEREAFDAHYVGVAAQLFSLFQLNPVKARK